MLEFLAKDIELSIDERAGTISSLRVRGRECCVSATALFRARLRDEVGECLYIDATGASSVTTNNNMITYKGFEGVLLGLSVTLAITADEEISWRAEVSCVPCGYALEWIELPRVCFPRLIDNDARGGSLLFPYNEGMLISDENALPRYEPEFPSSGAYFMFPNMLCSQFMAYLFDDVGFYIGAHDPKRGLKCIDFYPDSLGVSLQIRLYSGACYGEDFKSDFPIVWKACEGDWKSATEIYRTWLEANLPDGVVPVCENASIPDWYKGAPLIVTYPVRGIHDMDKMEPNELFPYTNALPILNRIKSDTGCQIMALLMHWEGTAPWAPPYAWPPFGGEALFNEFRDALHKNGDLLGIYCSGFGYTLRSTLIESYNCEEQIKRDDVLKGVCHSPQNKPELGRTCTPYQRYGYDICPASVRGREILDEAYAPIFDSGIDYAQILDQNHGGGQYMCFARDHEHPPMPGEWMTSNMRELLSAWNRRAPNMLFGCESASAEPFIGNLLMSDNRFELNYPFGKPVPVFAFLYHKYLRNFMGNQCGCPFEPKRDTLRYRLAYSFSIGDILTLILSPKGCLMTHWGTHDFESAPNMELALTLIKNLKRFYDEGGKKYLLSGRMSVSPDIECEMIDIPMFRGRDFITLPRLLCSTWEAQDGKTAYIIVNPETEPVGFSIDGVAYEAPALDATIILK